MDRHSRSTICLFSGASSGEGDAFMSEAFRVGKWIGENGFDLIYGGSFVGCMGAAAKGALESGATVTGVIPKYWRDLVPDGVSNLKTVVTKDLFDRKRIMVEEASGFIALPGGIGTIDEVFEVFTLNQVDQMSKPIVLLDLEDYFAPLMAMIEHAANRKFISDPSAINCHLVKSSGQLERKYFS